MHLSQKNGSRGAFFLISSFLKGLTYSAMIWLLGFLSLVKPFQANPLTGGITGSSNLHRSEKVQDPLVTKKWHFGCPNQNSENTFISSTSPKNDGIAFVFKYLPLLEGF